MGELPSRESLEMSLLLFTLISTVLVTSTTGHARCLTSALLRETSAHTSVHLSSTPLRICHGQLSWTRRRNGLRDPYELYHGRLGWGEQCPPPAEAVAANCGPWTIADCGDGKGMKSCPGE